MYACMLAYLHICRSSGVGVAVGLLLHVCIDVGGLPEIGWLCGSLSVYLRVGVSGAMSPVSHRDNRSDDANRCPV